MRPLVLAAIALITFAPLARAQEAEGPPPPRLVRLEAMDPVDMVKPEDLPIQLWDRPGGRLAGGRVIAALPAGTLGWVLPDPELSLREQVWLLLGLDTRGRAWPRWVRVEVSPDLAGWVRVEFTRPLPSPPPLAAPPAAR